MARQDNPKLGGVRLSRSECDLAPTRSDVGVWREQVRGDPSLLRAGERLHRPVDAGNVESVPSPTDAVCDLHGPVDDQGCEWEYSAFSRTRAGDDRIASE